MTNNLIDQHLGEKVFVFNVSTLNKQLASSNLSAVERKVVFDFLNSDDANGPFFYFVQELSHG